MAELLHQFSDWYLSVLGQGGYWLIAGLMALESTVVPIPSEVIIPPAAYLAQPRGSFASGVVFAGTVGSWAGASVMYWGSRWLGAGPGDADRPLCRMAAPKIAMAEAGPPITAGRASCFRGCCPVIRHLIGIPAGILRMDFRWYTAATLAGSFLWTSVLAWLGMTVGNHPELLKGSLHRFFLLVLAVAGALAALYYAFVRRPLSRA